MLTILMLTALCLSSLQTCQADGQDVRAAEETIQALQATVEEMKASMANMKSQLAKMESGILKQDNRTTRLDEKVFAQIDVLRGMSAEAIAGKVMFSAYMATDRSTEPTYDFRPEKGEVIPFHGVSVNHGGHFSTITSKFTCPRSGYYFFTFSIHSEAIKPRPLFISSAELLMNGQLQAKVYSHNYDPDHAMKVQGSNSVLLHCAAHSKVWLKACCDHNRMYGKSYDRTTTFAGFFLST